MNQVNARMLRSLDSHANFVCLNVCAPPGRFWITLGSTYPRLHFCRATPYLLDEVEGIGIALRLEVKEFPSGSLRLISASTALAR
jgi:hypothetical protein